MFRKVSALLLAIGLVAAVIGAGSALFTDSQAVDANSFVTGNVDISTNPTTELVTFSNMVPGDKVTAPITVSNGGSLALRYAITSTATNTDGKDLMSQLVLTIKSGVTDCNNSGFGTDGTQLYSGVLGAISSVNLVGDPTTGADSGDRALAAAGEETLCFNVALPSNTSNAFENAATSAVFDFVAEQTQNN